MAFVCPRFPVGPAASTETNRRLFGLGGLRATCVSSFGWHPFARICATDTGADGLSRPGSKPSEARRRLHAEATARSAGRRTRGKGDAACVSPRADHTFRRGVRSVACAGCCRVCSRLVTAVRRRRPAWRPTRPGPRRAGGDGPAQQSQLAQPPRADQGWGAELACGASKN